MLHQHTYINNCSVYHAASKKWLLKISYNIKVNDHTTLPFNIWSLKQRANVRKQKNILSISFTKLHIHVKTNFSLNIIFIYIKIICKHFWRWKSHENHLMSTFIPWFCCGYISCQFSFTFFSYTTITLSEIVNKNR